MNTNFIYKTGPNTEIPNVNVHCIQTQHASEGVPFFKKKIMLDTLVVNIMCPF